MGSSHLLMGFFYLTLWFLIHSVSLHLDLIMSAVWFSTLLVVCVTYSGAKDIISLGNDLDTFNYFYKELGCVKNKKTAASAFDCPQFPSTNGSCRFLNNYIPTGGKIDQELLKGSCIPECICKEDGFFLCPGTDCGLQHKEGCHQRNSLDTCCPTGLVCGDDIAKCEIEGKTYKEGEKFYLKNSCDVCVCDKGFKRETHCRPIKCNLEANRGDELSVHAAPVYLKDTSCCPSTWIIDEGEDQILPVIFDVKGPACTFGKREIPYGHGFQRNISQFGVEKIVKCECYSPPLVICNEE